MVVCKNDCSGASHVDRRAVKMHMTRVPEHLASCTHVLAEPPHGGYTELQFIHFHRGISPALSPVFSPSVTVFPPMLTPLPGRSAQLPFLLFLLSSFSVPALFPPFLRTPAFFLVGQLFHQQKHHPSNSLGREPCLRLPTPLVLFALSKKYSNKLCISPKNRQFLLLG